MTRGIYVHVPYCTKKCNYCDFYSVPIARQKPMNYADMLCRQFEAESQHDVPCDSIYFGGGTPCLPPVDFIRKILEGLRQNFTITPDAEITLEVNPTMAGMEKLEALRKLGINRLSIGVQALDDDQLRILGRLHTSFQTLEFLRDLFELDFKNVSCDVMVGIPRQSPESLCQTVENLCLFPITHLSAYMLKIEPNTPFGRHTPTLPSDDMQQEMYIRALEALEQNGFKQYEISNFALPGYECRHNLKYWTGGEYHAFGPAAAGYLNSTRFTYKRDIEAYSKAVNSGQTPPKSEEVFIDEAEKRRESIIFGLRMVNGIDLIESGLTKKPIGDYKILPRMQQAGLAVLEGTRLRLTPKGFCVSNSVINEVLDIIYN